MDLYWLLNTVPVLPSDGLLRWARPAMWAVVVAAVAAWATAKPWRRGPQAQDRQVARWVAGGVALWCLLPSPWSLAHHLSLAFMLPSWLTVLLCGCGLWKGLFAMNSGSINRFSITGKSDFSLKILPIGALVLGAVLLADTFILLPFALYRWGFGIAAVAALASVAAVVWAASGPQSGARVHASLFGATLVLHVVTRLPTGNVFDAVLDPLLWAGLVWAGLKGVFRGNDSPGAATTRG